MTYQGQGVAKPGVLKRNHAIIYTGKNEPAPQPKEQPVEGEKGMLQAIRVNPLSKQGRLHPLYRINFSKIYTVEHNVKVYNFGDVRKEHIHRLRRQWHHVLDQDLHAPGREEDRESNAANPAFGSIITQPAPAHWTRIDRRLVNPQALEEFQEAFEERLDCVIVLRVLTKEEIQRFADRTSQIRGMSWLPVPSGSV
jgi:hypothetical protein